MNMIHDPDVLENEDLSCVFEDIQKAVFRAARENQPVHTVENFLWEQMLAAGHRLLAQFFGIVQNPLFLGNITDHQRARQ